MLATRRPAELLKTRLKVVNLIRFLLDPLVIIATLGAVVVADGDDFDSAYLILLLFVFSLTFPGNWHINSRWPALIRDVTSGWMIVFFILLFFGYATKSLGQFPREVLVHWPVATLFSLLAAHALLKVALPRVLASEANRRRAVIVGANELGQRLAAKLHINTTLGISLAGFVDDREQERRGALSDPVLGRLTDLPALVQTHRIDQIYLAMPMVSQPRILNLLESLRDTTASIYFVPDIFVADLIQARVDNIDGIPVVAVCESPFYGVSGLIKRVSDIVFVTLILVLIAPLMLAIAIAVKWSSPGPVLFQQRRYGLDGREIWIYKFRSMTVCEDSGEIRQATRNDQRVTRIGAFLRKYSLDELPQFINVLQGRMSVVGPRPHAVAHNEMYRKLIKGYMVRHKVRPGVTGWAQVNGLRGETDTLEKMQARIEHDLEYLRTWSLGLDARIILRTVFEVISSKDVY
jgi:putative colanic acid biosynthesis UDP-glucose lipid carrier transferase